MLISITESCHMGCSHCMDDAKPCDRHMTLETFKDVINFFNLYGGIECVITGGEPTDNPNWLKMLVYALENIHNEIGISHITLTTNAMNFAKNIDIQTYLMMLMQRYPDKLNVQVTHVDKYYPQPVELSSPFFSCSAVIVCNEIENMYPMGRARTNNLPWSSKASKCFNIRSLVRKTKDLQMSCLYLAARGKFCTPQIDYLGNIKLGESCLCPIVSNIYKPINEIINDICNFRCHNCDMINKNLSINRLNAIGEID